MKRSRIPPLSPKREQQLKDEIPIRRALCERAKGVFITDGKVSRCIGGICEICKRPPDWLGLHPHEKVFRSRGGKLSLENSIMVCDSCGKREHGIVTKIGIILVKGG